MLYDTCIEKYKVKNNLEISSYVFDCVENNGGKSIYLNRGIFIRKHELIQYG
jgi:Mor family transcriptional regulator